MKTAAAAGADMKLTQQNGKGLRVVWEKAYHRQQMRQTGQLETQEYICLLYTSPSPRD